LKMIFREKEIHLTIITKRKRPPSWESGQLNYKSLRAGFFAVASANKREFLSGISENPCNSWQIALGLIRSSSEIPS
jgi:hypothetical protein